MNNTVQILRNAVGGTLSGNVKQLIVFPFGGGSGYAFSGLAREIDKDVEVVSVNPPGHFIDDSRPIESIDEMVSHYFKELRPVIRNNCVLFGHSIGSVVAYELCKVLEQRFTIKKLVLSSVHPPHLIADTLDMKSEMSNETLLDMSERMGGMPQIFREEPSLLGRFVSGLRADLVALEKYISARTGSNIPKKLKTTAVVLYSDDDYIVEPEKMQQWQDYLDCSEFVVFTGHHFHLLENPGLLSVAEVLNRELNR